MTATYNPSLPLDRDHVRFLTGDSVTSAAQLSDEEIDAVLSEQTATGEAKKYYAAAQCLEILLLRWASKGKGVSSKSVSRLSISWGVAGTSTSIVQERIRELRKRGAWILSSAPRPLRLL